MEKIKKWLGRNIAVVLLGTLVLMVVFNRHKKERDPAIDRLLELNDSLFKQNELNKQAISDYLSSIDTLTVEQQVIYDRRPITNNTYKNETFNIVNADYTRDDTDYVRAIQFSDSLLKAGHYYRTYELPETVIRP